MSDDTREVQRLIEGTARCPRCFFSAVVLKVGKGEVTWDEAGRRFIVHVSFDAQCASAACFSRWEDSVVVESIPLIVAEESACACGATLRLTNHTLSVGDDGLVTFTGEYVCDACHKAEQTLLKRIGRKLAAMWRQTKKIEVGLKGVTYEKESTSD